MKYTDTIFNIFKANEAHREQFVKKQLKQIPYGMKILDVGCGGQPYHKYCSHLKYKAHDFGKLEDSQIIEGRYGKIDYVSDICHIPENDAFFDVILCTEVLEHIPEPICAVKEIARLLKPGGYLILTAPLGSFLHQLPYHFYGGFTPNWYEKYLQQAGFTNIMIEQNGGFFRYFGQECQRITRILFRSRPMISPLRLLLLPFEMISILVFTILSPLLCYFLDKFISTPNFTIGYHILSRKK